MIAAFLAIAIFAAALVAAARWNAGQLAEIFKQFPQEF